MNSVSQRTVNARNVNVMRKQNADAVLILKQIVTTNTASQTADVALKRMPVNVLVMKLLVAYALIYKASSFLLIYRHLY